MIPAMSASDSAPPPARGGPLSMAATLLATGFGSGYAPVAPGTAGTAVGLLLFWPLQALAPTWQLAATGVLFVLGCAVATHVARRLNRKDPGVVVVDEIVGIWASLLWLPLTPQTALLGFLLFRLLDMVKPFPARQFEALPGGLGIMADDLMAGVYVNLILRVVAAIVPLA
jgi:phosphatidylglycerophosphatase A